MVLGGISELLQLQSHSPAACVAHVRVIKGLTKGSSTHVVDGRWGVSPAGALMADRTPRLPSVGLLRRLTLLSLLLTAAVWVVQYSALLCDPPPPALERVARSSPFLPSFPSLSRQSPSAVARWLRASLSSHAVSPTHTACLLPANQSDPGFTTLLALGDLHLSVNRPDGELDTPSLLQPLPQGMSGVDAVVGNLASAVAGSEELAALRWVQP